MSSSEPNNQVRWTMPGWLVSACVASILIGAAGLALAFASSPRDGWLWLLVDFVIFWGIASGAFVWAAAFRTAQATWTSAVNRLAHSTIAFVPALAIMLIALLLGLRGYAPWIEHPAHGKEAWLNVPAFTIREIIAAVAFWVACLALVRQSLMGVGHGHAVPDPGDGGHAVPDGAAHRLNVTAVVVVALFTITATLISWDFIMSLAPEWVSTVFSVYYFCTSAYAGMAVLILMAAALRKPLGLEDRLKPAQFQDMGNLMLAFSLFTMGLFFAQYVTIWYENLPEETPFIVLRYLKGVWPPLGWTAFLLGYAIPFIVLQSRTVKLNPKLLSIVAGLVLVGTAIERYVLVVPSLVPNRLLIAPAGVLSLLGFAGAFVLSIGWFLGRYSPVSVADEVLPK